MKPSLTKAEQEALKTFRKRALERFAKRIVKVLLFGSRARGEGYLESDFDVFVMVDAKDRKITEGLFDIAHDIYFESDFTINIYPVIMSQGYFGKRLKLERKIAVDIERDGVPI